MLILTLMGGASIDITLEDGRRIELHGLEGRARIGFNAPKTITIDRHVVTQRKAGERGEEPNGNR